MAPSIAAAASLAWLPCCGCLSCRSLHPIPPFTPCCCSYKAALRACPTCPPEVRLGIAACCLRLGSTVKAEAAYKRVLELEPDCTPALLGLAVLKLHVSNEEEVRRFTLKLWYQFTYDEWVVSGCGRAVRAASAKVAGLPACRTAAASSESSSTPHPLPLSLPPTSMQGVLEGSVLLAQAFEQDPENPFVLLLLSHFCLRQGIPHKVGGCGG